MGTVDAKKLKHMHPDIQHSMSELVQVPILAWNILTGPAGKLSVDVIKVGPWMIWTSGGGAPCGGGNNLT